MEVWAARVFVWGASGFGLLRVQWGFGLRGYKWGFKPRRLRLWRLVAFPWFVELGAKGDTGFWGRV